MPSQTIGPFTRGACSAAAALPAAATTPLASTVRRVRSMARPLPALDLHLLQHRAAEEAQRIADHLGHLEVVVALGDQQRDRLPRRFDGGGEFAVLALELRCLEGAVGDDHRAVEPVEMALRG